MTTPGESLLHPTSGGPLARPPDRRVTEEVREVRIPLRVHPEWARVFPWVVHGTTVRTRGDERQTGHARTVRTRPDERPTARADDPKGGHDRAAGTRGDAPPDDRVDGRGADIDFGLFTGAPAGAVMTRWELLAEVTGCGSVIHARQVHGCEITLHGATPPGLLLVPPCDGHATCRPGTLLSVSVADCVPVFVVAPRPRAVMLLHAGWRGVAGGILEAGLAMLERDLGTHAHEAHIHMGPAICGRCYEVGREVHKALGLPRPASAAQPVDLRGVLAHRALAAGADPAQLTTSTFCTRCGDTPFFSHRSGDAGRQIAVLGIASNDSAPSGEE